MTQDEFTARLPLLTVNPMPVKPPFVFNNLSVRTFPLRASQDALQQLCNDYLNFVPPEVGYFRASAPYVMLMVLDYGQVSEAVSRIGWFSQLEVFFSVPIEWYKKVNGKWQFHDWAVITPYIFVSDTFSVPLGRTVYGFPKILANVTWAPSGWTTNPVSPVTLARVETAVFPDAFAGRDLENRVFLEVERSGPIVAARLPPAGESVFLPWNIASNAVNSMSGFVRDWMRMAQSIRTASVHPALTPGIAPQMLGKLAQAMRPSGPGFVQNSLNLKQFRRADQPDLACFQALTSGRMATTSFNGAGFLGEDRLLLGDSSGGHTIKLFQHSSLPIARVLGLEVERTIQTEDGAANVAELKPLLPYWMDLDLLYEQAENVVWRGDDGVWKDGAGQAVSTQLPTETAPRFNIAVSSAIDAVSGPFQFPNATTRVLPLLAHTANMQKFLDDFINHAICQPLAPPYDNGQQVRLRVWDRPELTSLDGTTLSDEHAYVYLTATHFDSVLSQNDNVGNWAGNELTFLIPVKWERWVDGDWHLEGVGVVPAYTFVDGGIAAASRFEIQGIDARKGDFLVSKGGWLCDQTPANKARQSLLRLDAEVWPALGAGLKAITQPVVEISHQDLDGAMRGEISPDSPRRWADVLGEELLAKKLTRFQAAGHAKVGRALALELLGNQVAVSHYSLKQFRDVRDPDKACYQQLVRVPRQIDELLDLREIEETLVVHIHDYASLNIAETLGLVSAAPTKAATGVTRIAQAVRPFSIRGMLSEALATPVMTRWGGGDWHVSPDGFRTLLSDREDAPPLEASLRAETLIDQVNPTNIAAVIAAARMPAQEVVLGPDHKPLTPPPPQQNHIIPKNQAREALAMLDPQSIIEAVLSREWGNTDQTTRWLAGLRQLETVSSRLTLGGPGKPATDTFSYVQFIVHLSSRPGAVSAISAGWSATLHQILESQFNFTSQRLELERNFDQIEAFNVLGLGITNAIGITGFLSQGGNPAELALKLPVVTEDQLRAAATGLLNTIRCLAEMPIVGEPSPRSHAEAHADQQRLRELLSAIGGDPAKVFEGSTGDDLRRQVGGFREVVDLARRICETQRAAVHYKLSRAYQKPDYCVRRDSVGSACEQLYPQPLCWDEEWFYGNTILNPDVTDASSLLNPFRQATTIP